MGLTQPVQKMTAAEYLAIERKAETKSEFFDGKMVAMARCADRHCILSGNVLAELGFKLRGKRCRPYHSDMRVKTTNGLYTYPDVSVTCGEQQFEDEITDTLLNPTVIIEVLSESTERYDRGKKFDNYRTIQSLREYVLVSQSEPMVQTFLRNDDGSWTLRPIDRLDESVPFESINVTVPMSDIYRDVVFDEQASPS